MIKANENFYGGSPDVAVEFEISSSEMRMITNFIISYLDQNCKRHTCGAPHMCSDALAVIGVDIPGSWRRTFWYNSAPVGSHSPGSLYSASLGAFGEELKDFIHPKIKSKSLTGFAFEGNQGSCE